MYSLTYRHVEFHFPYHADRCRVRESVEIISKERARK
jgi:hypothetical protein